MGLGLGMGLNPPPSSRVSWGMATHVFPLGQTSNTQLA
jgi:hypothetical protein